MTFYENDETPGESIAEYFRAFITDREAALTKFPKFTQYLYDTISDSDAKDLVKLSDMFHDYLSLSRTERYAKSERTDKRIGSLNISKIQRGIENALEQPLTVAKNLYLFCRNTRI